MWLLKFPIRRNGCDNYCIKLSNSASLMISFGSKYNEHLVIVLYKVVNIATVCLSIYVDLSMRNRNLQRFAFIPFMFHCMIWWAMIFFLICG